MGKEVNDILRIPYMGSKQSIVKKIYEAINNDLNNKNDCLFTYKNEKINIIYDLFCGGGSVGYYFYNQGWQVYMNDIQEPLIELHKVLNMENSPLTKELLYKWISREEFKELIKRQDWYGELIRCCWSFGNSCRGYLFGKNIENYKKQLHFVIFNKDLQAGKNFLEMIGKQDDWNYFSKIYDIENQKQRRLFIRKYICENIQNKSNKRKLIELENLERLQNLAQLQQLEQLEQLERLQQLERLEQLEQLERLQQLQQQIKNINFSCKNYYEIDIKTNSLIYCDIPYLGTQGYNKQTFDYEKFDNWVREMKNKGIKVYISEYTNHNNEWREICSINKYSLFNNSKETKTLKQEKIFCNI